MYLLQSPDTTNKTGTRALGNGCPAGGGGGGYYICEVKIDRMRGGGGGEGTKRECLR